MYDLYFTGPAWYVSDGDDDGVYGGPRVHQQEEREEENKKQIYLPGKAYVRYLGTHQICNNTFCVRKWNLTLHFGILSPEW